MVGFLSIKLFSKKSRDFFKEHPHSFNIFCLMSQRIYCQFFVSDLTTVIIY